jgi:parallel beta-helix repeat protein
MKWQEWKEMERMHTMRLPTLLTILLLLSITILAPGTLGGTMSKNIVQDLETSIEISPGNTTIQDAINHAKPGATLKLPAGVYTEVLTINKPIHLKGEGSTQTILSTTSPNNGYAIRITAEGVTLSGLDISNQGPGIYTTCVKISASSTTIQNCSFHATPIGIAIWNSTNTISGCDFIGCDDEGIVLLGTTKTPCSNNTITSCTFHENCDGIELQSARDNLIAFCTFTHNTHAGIDAIESNNNNNIISHCEFNNNQGFGLYLTGSTNNLITQCTFSDDTITFVQASENTLQKSQAANIHLMEDSSLLIEQCEDIVPSAIISQQSSYEILADQSNQPSQKSYTQEMVQHPFLIALLSRFKILKSLYDYLHQSRM